MKKIVLVHGWGASVEKLMPLKSALERLGWKVLLPKLPGFGIPIAKPFEVLDYAKFLNSESTKYFQGKFVVFGHSNGGRIASLMAVEFPARVSGIVLCATGGVSRASIVKRAFFFTLAKIGKLLLIAPPIAKLWRTALYKTAREHDYEKANGAMRETFRNMVSFRLKPFLLKITQPVLILWGKEDRMTPVRDAYFLERRLKKASLIVYPKYGHTLPYMNYMKIAQDIDSWKKSL